MSMKCGVSAVRAVKALTSSSPLGQPIQIRIASAVRQERELHISSLRQPVVNSFQWCVCKRRRLSTAADTSRRDGAQDYHPFGLNDASNAETQDQARASRAKDLNARQIGGGRQDDGPASGIVTLRHRQSFRDKQGRPWSTSPISRAAPKHEKVPYENMGATIPDGGASIDNSNKPREPQSSTSSPTKKSRKPRLELRDLSNKAFKQDSRLNTRSVATSPTTREPWQTQKKALTQKFGTEGWNPRKKVSPDTMDGIRQLHEDDSERWSTPALAEHFKMSPEAIRRILKSKWRPKDEKAVEERKERWARRHDRIWDYQAELGLRPQRVKNKEVEDPDEFDEEMRAKEMLDIARKA